MTAPSPRHPGPPLLPYLLAAVFPVLAAAVLASAYPSIPEVYAVHWGADGQPDRFEEKTWLSVMTLPLMALLMVPLLSATAFIQRAAARAYPVSADPDAGVALPWSDSVDARGHVVMGSVNRWLGWLTLGVSLGMSIMAVATAVPVYGGWMPVGLTVTLASAGVAVIGALVSVVRNPVKLREIPADEAELERTRILRDDSAFTRVHRVGGLIYSNPADPMLMVPAQHQDGNVNFNVAHAPGRRFWALLLTSLALLVLIPLLTSL